jgi:methyl-accepting chemotaxis protein
MGPSAEAPIAKWLKWFRASRGMGVADTSQAQANLREGSAMKTQDINKKIDDVAEKAKEINIKASDRFHQAAVKAGRALQETAEKVAQSAQELASKAEQLAREASPKRVPGKHAKR